MSNLEAEHDLVPKGVWVWGTGKPEYEHTCRKCQRNYWADKEINEMIRKLSKKPLCIDCV
jgi:hypothetical protein